MLRSFGRVLPLSGYLAATLVMCLLAIILRETTLVEEERHLDN